MPRLAIQDAEPVLPGRVVHLAGSPAEQRYDLLVECAPVPILVCGRAGVEYANAACARLLGLRSPADVIGTPLSRWIAERDAPALRATARALQRSAGATRTVELRLRAADGRLLDVEALASGLGQRRGTVAVVLHDITARKEIEQRLFQGAFHDALTGLPNRALVEDRLDQALLAGARAGSGPAVLFIDLDNFKAVNDRLGHAAGDSLLREVAQRLRHSVRPADTVARLGGDEFLVLVEDLDEQRDAVQVARRILQHCTGAYEVAGRKVRVSLSVGVAMNVAGGGPHDLQAAADRALYRVKGRGGAGYEIADLASPGEGGVAEADGQRSEPGVGTQMELELGAE